MDLIALGRRVQAARLDRGLTLQDVAAASGVSVSMLSSVERGAKAPTVVVLDRVASGLGVPLARLLAESDADRVVVRRRAEHEVVHEAGGWARTILTPVVPGVNFEWVRTTLPSGCDAGAFPAYAAGSHEFVVVDAGELTLTLDAREVVLGAGDVVYFAADVAHRYANRGAVDCSYQVAALIMRSRGRRG
ncbi:helix-turn-helix domain-containing protein [Pseudonocardia nigra]|uniref:helix-turn-helix domain-containing protein n=1 Tax=Pseudonocardia nigra TaxID=1921578 RepID=UPI001C5E7C81|nr:XRE family transcriptional regulator [Pseudonocardia nigra]